LIQSVKHSEYVAIKLKLWQDDGKNDLTKFLLTLGIPEHEYTQQYRYMDQKYKNALKEQVKKVGENFGLNDLQFPSFVRQINTKTQMNAADMVYVVTSLLESPKPVMIDNIPADANIEEIQKHLEVFEPKDLTLKEFQQTQVDNFWSAVESLNIKNFDLIN
jgi:cell division control protein 45